MPKVPFVNNQQDGPMRYHSNSGKVNYEPNTLNNGSPMENHCFEVKPEFAEGKIERKKISLTDDFTQACEQYRAYSDEERNHLIDNLVNDLWCVDKKIQLKVIEHFTKADKDYGRRVKEGLKIKF